VDARDRTHRNIVLMLLMVFVVRVNQESRMSKNLFLSNQSSLEIMESGEDPSDRRPVRIGLMDSILVTIIFSIDEKKSASYSH
jgi:hypothetical protein